MHIVESSRQRYFCLIRLIHYKDFLCAVSQLQVYFTFLHIDIKLQNDWVEIFMSCKKHVLKNATRNSVHSLNLWLTKPTHHQHSLQLMHQWQPWRLLMHTVPVLTVFTAIPCIASQTGTLVGAAFVQNACPIMKTWRWRTSCKRKARMLMVSHRMGNLALTY